MSWDSWREPDPQAEKDPTWGDYGQVLKSSTGSMLSGTAGVLRNYFDDGKGSAGELWRAVGDIGNKFSEESTAGMTEEGRDRFEAGITSPKFWEHPFSSMALKATGQVPNLVAMALPGGVIKGVAGQLAAGAAGGVLSAGDLVGGVYQKVDALSSDELKEQSPLYRGLLADNDGNERKARQEYTTTLIGMKPAIAFALGAGSEFFGPVGNVLRGTTKEGVRHGIGKAALEGAASETADEGYGAYGQQKAEIEGGLRKEYDPMAIIDQALTGGALGGAFGGVSGIGGGHGKGKAKADEIKANRAGEEDAGVQAEAGQAEVAVPAKSAATKAAEKKGVVIGVDPAIEAALADKTQAPPKINPEAAVPPTPAQPAAPPSAAAPEAVPPSSRPDVAQAQQAPTSPPSGPAAAPPQLDASGRTRGDTGFGEPPSGVTPQVTTPAAKPQLDENTLTELAKRGILPEEAAQLSPEQLQTVMASPAPAAAQAAGTSTSTDISARRRTPEATPSEQVATATPVESPVPSVTPSAPAEVATAPVSEKVSSTAGAPETATPKGRVLQDISEEGKGKQKAQAVAQAAREKAGLAEPAEKVVKPKKAAVAHKAAQAARAAAAEGEFKAATEAHTLEIPKTPEERKALGARLKPVVDDILSRTELRENLPEHILKYYNTKGSGIELTPEEHARYHRSLPERVGHQSMSPHVRYLRELIDVQKVLEKGEDLGPKSGNYRRVMNFIAAHNQKAPELITMSRKEAGEEIATSRRGGSAEQGEGQQAKQEAGAAAPGAVVKSAASEGAAAPGKVLEGEAKAKAIAELQAKLNLTAKAAEKVATAQISKTAEPAPEIKPAKPAKPGMPKVVAEKVAITKPKPEPKAEPKPEPKPEKVTPKVTEEAADEDAPPPRKVWPMTDVSRPDMHEGAREAHKELNKIKEWVNGLTDANYDRLPEFAHRQMQDTNDIAGVRRIAKAFEEEFGYNVLKEKVTAKHAVDVAQAAPVAPRQPKVVTDKRAAMKAALEKQRAALAAKGEGDGIVRMASDGNRGRAVELADDEHEVWDSPLHKARDLYGHDDASIGFSGKVTEVLRNLNMDHLEGVPKYVKDFVRRRLTEFLGNTQIHFADASLMRDATGDTVAPHGYFHPGKGARPGYIVVQAGLDQKRMAHAVIHEALHAALWHRINANVKLRVRIEKLMQHLDENTKGLGEKKHARYAMTNVHEFISEALSNPDLQNQMMKIVVTPEQAKRMGFEQPQSQSLWGAFVNKVREIMGLPPGSFNLLERTLRVIAPELEAARSEAASIGQYKPYKGTSEPQRLMDMDKLRDAAVGQAAATTTNTKGKLALAKDKMSSLWMMAQRNAKLFGESNPLNRLFDTRAFMERAKDIVLEKYGGLKATVNIAKAERAHPELMAKAKQILFDASLHDVNLDGSNDHLGKDRLMGVQAKGEVERLQKAWNDPTLNPVRGTLRQAAKFFKDVHNAVSRETINNVLAEANIHDPALAERIHQGGLTEEDKATWADDKLVSALDAVKDLKRRQGTYVPFRRYGDFSTTANHELSVPTNATKINDNTLQFVDPRGEGGNARARAAVKNYLRSNSHTPQGNKLTPQQIQKVWVDKNNPSQIIEAEDPNAIPAYRVAMQTQHTEMHETRAEAEQSKKDLEDAGLVGARAHAREDAYKGDRNIQGAMGTILRSLEKQQRYIDADPTQKAAMREMFHDLTLGLSGTTSIKNSMRQRRNVAGMSHDLGRVTGDYARMTANHLAMLQYRPKIDAIFKEMREYRDAHENDKDSIRRDEVYKEFVDRIYGRSAAEAEKHKPGAVTRLLQMSRLSRLAGPSFHIINAHEPWTTSLPVIGGRQGFGATLRGLTDAYNFIGGRAAAMAGLRDTAKAYTNDSGFTDYVKLFKDTIGKSKIAGPEKIGRMQDVIDYMNARNLYSNASIFEVGKYANPEGNVAGRALDRADLMANQVGSAIESINRTVTGLTAYNLEYKKNGGNHEAAMHYAYSVAHETMGDYSHWNAAPIFNTPLGRVALQFKKFGHKTYYLLGNTMGGALRGDPQAMKQFAGLMVTHGLVAGALGLPTEPFKVALMAANAVGATGFTPDDYDYAVRQLAARVAGQKGGEIISKGLYRGIGVEVSGRFGLDNLLTYGAPKSQKDADIKSWLFDTMAGAPAGYLLDQIKALQAAFKGDFATAVEKSSPLRTVGDITKAAVGLYGEKKGPSGKTTQEQFTPYQAGIRALGFTPSSASELGAMRGQVARESMRQSADRSAVVNAWVDASGSQKVAAQRAVQAFNAGRPKDEQITSKDLTNAARKRQREEKTTEHGITTSKRTQAIYDRAEGIFNP